MTHTSDEKGWRSIATAPLRTRVLLLEGEDVYAGIKTSSRGCWLSFCGQPVVYTPEPSHWMPLPEPPQVQP